MKPGLAQEMETVPDDDTLSSSLGALKMIYELCDRPTDVESSPPTSSYLHPYPSGLGRITASFTLVIIIKNRRLNTCYPSALLSLPSNTVFGDVIRIYGETVTLHVALHMIMGRNCLKKRQKARRCALSFHLSKIPDWLRLEKFHPPFLGTILPHDAERH